MRSARQRAVDRRRGRALSAVRTIGLAALAAAGTLSLVWAAASLLLGWRLVVVTTGSMEPAVGVGSASVAVPVDAAELRIGDVVTVPRDEGRPSITHRIVAIDPVDSSSSARSLTLRGDANTADDPEPYRVERVDRVVATVPGLGQAFAMMRTPEVAMAATLLLAGLVLWAMWPSVIREPDDATEYP